MIETAIDSFEGHSGAFGAMRDAVAAADNEVLVSVPVSHLDAVEPALREAVERDVKVLLFLGGAEPDGERLDGLATVVRYWREVDGFLIMGTADETHGVVIPPSVPHPLWRESAGIAFRSTILKSVLFSTILGNIWNMGTEIHRETPSSLPRSYGSFLSGLVEATLHLEAGHAVHVTAECRERRDQPDTVTVEGRLTNVRQSFISPWTSSFPTEHMLMLECDGEEVTVGGPGAFLEDYAAESVRLDTVDG